MQPIMRNWASIKGEWIEGTPWKGEGFGEC